MKKGFTLIELLAVIVILAIIALIATPIVLDIINDSKDSSLLRSAQFYLDGAEISIADRVMNHGGISDGTYNILENGNICLEDYDINTKTCKDNDTKIDNNELIIEVDGEVPDSGTITIINGQISNISLNLSNKTVIKNNKGELVLVKLLTDYIKKLYSETTTATVNNIEYSLDETHSLMNDRLGSSEVDKLEGNIRYYGASPNNYIDIGDRDSEGNIIFWRIIGLFKDIEVTDEEGNVIKTEDLVKIVRADSIGEYSWDNKSSGIGSSLDDRGSNDWSDSRLMMLLNPGYDIYNTTNPLKDDSGDILYGYEGSLWWNSKKGICYSGKNNVTEDCDFTSSGLSNASKNKIETVIWDLGGADGNKGYVNEALAFERGDATYQDESLGIKRPSNWSGKVALMYVSDYGYMSDLSDCDLSLFNYVTNEACIINNWISNTRLTFLTPLSINARNIMSKYDTLMVTRTAAYNAYDILPVLYLNSNVGIVEEKETREGLKYFVVE